MADITLEKFKDVYKIGQPMTSLHLITQGSVNVTYPGGNYQIGKGDVIGICEVCSEVHFLSYSTTENTSILTYPIANADSLFDLLTKHPDVARLFLLSAFRQIANILQNWSLSKLNCGTCYHNLRDDYETYLALTNRFQLQPRMLNGLSTLTAYMGEELPEQWLGSYYTGLTRVYATDQFKPMIQEASVSFGLIQKCSYDCRKALTCIDEQYQYLQHIASFYFTQSNNDIFDMYTSLFYKIGLDHEESNIVLEHIRRMESQTKFYATCNQAYTDQRINSFENNISNLLIQHTAKDPMNIAYDLASKVTHSLNTILDFAGADLELTTAFREHIQAYKQLDDKNAPTTTGNKIRKELTDEFYTIYSIVFANSLTAKEIPMPVKMFLYFGYVDEELAGMDNTVTLFKLAQNMADYTEFGVYTFYDWLKAIFNGKKIPSRSESDLDFIDYIQKQKMGGFISANELKDLEQNAMSKINYEMRNMLPFVNKATYGRPNDFCPIFHADSVLKTLEGTFVTLSNIKKAMEKIRSIDYTAFYRSSIETNYFEIVGKELVHSEWLPDIILMPNVGTKGIMWQEIEGKNRNSSGRMCVSIFHLEDLTSTFIHMAGEFRWELCKRIQGTRWNDVTDHSLTSDYYDYISYYKKNTALSADAKERIRQNMQWCKNSYKEMFIRDYTQWILYESNGTAKLNKLARRILFTYCPFPAHICKSLENNPLYTDLIIQYNSEKTHRINHLNQVAQKFKTLQMTPPPFISLEQAYAAGILPVAANINDSNYMP